MTNFSSLFCDENPLNPNGDEELGEFFYIMLLVSNDPRSVTKWDLQNALAITVTSISILVQILLLRKAMMVKRSLRSANSLVECEHQPTYCTLTVIII